MQRERSVYPTHRKAIIEKESKMLGGVTLNILRVSLGKYLNTGRFCH